MRTLLAIGAAMALAGHAASQHLIAYGDPPLGPGLMGELQLPTVMLPGPLPPIPLYPIAPLLPPPPALVPQTGDATFQSVTVLTWYTNGGMLAAMPTPSFPPAGPVPAPFPIAPAVLAAIGGAVTGIAVDSIAGIMYLTSVPGIVIGVAPVPGTPVLVPPFLPPFAMGPISGLEWDSITGSLFACDIAGIVYNFLPGGAPLGPPIVPVVPLLGPAQDVAIDKTGFLNAFGVRSIYLSSGPAAIDITMPAPPIPLGMPGASGLAFLARPAANTPGARGCPCGPMLPTFGTTGPMVTGNAAFGITVGGVPPGSLVVTAYDWGYNPALPLINVTGCGSGLIGTPGMTFNFGFANAVGVATWALSLVGLPPGLGPVFAQAGVPCPIDPAGFTLTATMQLNVCGL